MSFKSNMNPMFRSKFSEDIFIMQGGIEDSIITVFYYLLKKIQEKIGLTLVGKQNHV